MKGQLTGIPRQIKDSVADIYNCVQKWKKINLNGFGKLKEVCDLKLALLISLNPSEQLHLLEKHKYSEELNAACNELVEIFLKIEEVVTELSKITGKFTKLLELASFNCTLGNDSNNIPFTGWPISQFAQYAEEISDMFCKELSVKRCIVESAAHVDHIKNSDDIVFLSESCRDILMTYTSCWLHEPYINETTLDILIEGLLFETGHSS